jgi:hypothetical protein
MTVENIKGLREYRAALLLQWFLPLRCANDQARFGGIGVLTNQNVDICGRIQRERRVGKTRCGVVAGKMTIAEVARAFGLADDANIYRSIGRVEADRIAIRALGADLAHQKQIMSPSSAAELWQRFMTLFDGQDVEFVSNTDALIDAWSPATPATFDMGVLVIGEGKAGCFWVEDED